MLDLVVKRIFLKEINKIVAEKLLSFQGIIPG